MQIFKHIHTDSSGHCRLILWNQCLFIGLQTLIVVFINIGSNCFLGRYFYSLGVSGITKVDVKVWRGQLNCVKLDIMNCIDACWKWEGKFHSHSGLKGKVPYLASVPGSVLHVSKCRFQVSAMPWNFSNQQTPSWCRHPHLPAPCPLAPIACACLVCCWMKSLCGPASQALSSCPAVSIWLSVRCWVSCVWLYP
jgi:hypothetical protein